VTAAAVLAAPDLAWQAAHGWPNLPVFQQLQELELDGNFYITDLVKEERAPMR